MSKLYRKLDELLDQVEYDELSVHSFRDDGCPYFLWFVKELCYRNHEFAAAAMFMLLSKGPDINVRNDEDHTPLMVAAENASTGIMEILLDHGADIHATSVGTAGAIGDTALKLAVEYLVDTPMICTLLERGAIIEPHHRLIELAMDDRRYDTVTLLFEYGCDVEQPDAEGWTLLHHAIWNVDDVEYIRILVNHGADVNAMTRDGDTPLSMAVDHDMNDGQLAHLLIEHGAYKKKQGEINGAI